MPFDADVQLKIVTKGSRETQKLAVLLAKEIYRNPHIWSFNGRQAAVLALKGDLGTGKTTFIQGFAKGLGIGEKVLSPTFLILKIFKMSPKSRLVAKSSSHSVTRSFRHLYHLDCYRIDDAKEISAFGFKEIIADPKNIVIIEWADRIKKILPKKTFWLNFKWLDKNKRKIIITVPEVHKVSKVHKVNM